MPMDYSSPVEVVSRSASRVRPTQVRLNLRQDDPERDQVRFMFQAVKVEQVPDPAWKPPMIDDPDFEQPDPDNPVPVPQIPDESAEHPQIEKLTPVDNKSLQKTLKQIATDHPEDFAKAHAAIKAIAYAYMTSEKLFPEGGTLS
jgi:hypothetical protein